ncbi:uroporphyrinogen-III synthase [Halobacteriaceae archaeon GCM10025711]
MSRPSLAVFRPDDERLDRAVALLDDLGVDAVGDPMLAVRETDRVPRDDADYALLTSRTGVELAADAGWDPGAAAVCAIGPRTAGVLEDHGYAVDLVPDEYTSEGLVDALRDAVDGARVEVARSDHGAQVLLDGLNDAGAYVHETVLYDLVRPAGAGDSAERAARGDLDGALFTSSMTAEHFVAAARERGVLEGALDGLDRGVVGAIGAPTRETAESLGITVDVVPEDATFEALARAVVARLGEA